MGNLFCLTLQRQSGPPAPLPHHFHVHPAHPAAPARPQRLHRGLFHREAPRVPLVLVFELFAVGDFIGRIHAPQKPFPLRLNDRLNALHFRHINAQSDDHSAPPPRPDYTVRTMPRWKSSEKKSANRKRASARPLPLSPPWVMRRSRGVQILQLTPFRKLPWLVHGFSTRTGGVSQLGGRQVLNLGFMEWDTHENVAENRRLLQAALGAEDFTLTPLKQIHSDVIHLLSAAPAHACKGDASATNRPGLLLAVQTADCVPILLVDPQKRAVAAIHAGWKGTLARIAEKAVGRMRLEFGSKPADLLAALGP